MPAARTVRYGLFDLLTLACDLVAPILDPLFGGVDDLPSEQEPAVKPSPATEPTAPAVPTPEPMFPGEVVPAMPDVPVIVAERPAHPCTVCGGGIGWDAPSGVCSRECLDRGQGFPVEPPPSVISDAPEADRSASVAENSAFERPAEPLYVRRGDGRGARYLLATDTLPGPRFCRRLRGKRPVYEPAGAGR